MVALTANAFSSDVQASLAAGCDRHMAKPYTRAQLLQTLDELASHVDMPAISTKPPAAALAASEPGGAGASNSPPFDQQAAVRRLGGDQALYQRVVDHAAVFMVGWLPAWEPARVDDDKAQALRLTRDLRAVAATLGAAQLSDCAAALEAPLREGGAVEPALETLRQALSPVIVALSRSRSAS